LPAIFNRAWLVEQAEQRLLGQRAREDDALFFTAGDLIHPAVAQFGGADLGESVFRDQDIVALKSQRAPMGMAALQDKFPGTPEKSKVLSCWTTAMTCARVRGVNDWMTNPLSNMRPERGARAPEINFRRVDLPLALGPRMATISPGLAESLSLPA